MAINPLKPSFLKLSSVNKNYRSTASASELAYATDEDSYASFDPEAKPWDLSRDPLQFCQWQMDNALAIWEQLETFYPSPGESYGELREQFDRVLGYYFNQALTISNYVGGRRFNRQHPAFLVDDCRLNLFRLRSNVRL